MNKQSTILLVDDDTTFLETTKIALENNYNIITATNGSECLEIIKTGKPNLIILDVMMSHLGEGINVAREIKTREETKDIPIIMLTGVDKVYDMSTQIDKSQYSHSELWLEKPIDNEQLLKEVETILARK
ncbi:response regulator [Spirochaetota bacterium]